MLMLNGKEAIQYALKVNNRGMIEWFSSTQAAKEYYRKYLLPDNPKSVALFKRSNEQEEYTFDHQIR